MRDCKFCQIAAGKIPSFRVFENEQVFVFLDIHPESEGHMLIIPKVHYVNMYDIPEKLLCEIISTAKKIALRLKESDLADGVNITNANGISAQQSVMHYHLHLLPRKTGDGLDCAGHSGYHAGNFEALAKKYSDALNK